MSLNDLFARAARTARRAPSGVSPSSPPVHDDFRAGRRPPFAGRHFARRPDCWVTSQRTTSRSGLREALPWYEARSSPPGRRRTPEMPRCPRRRLTAGGAASRRPTPHGWLAIAVACAQPPHASASDAVPYVDAVIRRPALVAQALAYEHGEGVPKDPLKAAALYCAAARDGDPEAQFSLGWMYANGRGVAHDDAVAASLFALAAAAGHRRSRRGCCASSATIAARCPIACARPNLRRAAGARQPMSSPTPSPSFPRGNRRSPTRCAARPALRAGSAARARDHRRRIELRAQRALGRRTRAG